MNTEQKIRELVPELQEQWKDLSTGISHYEVEEIQLHHVLLAISGDGKLADEFVVINAGGGVVVLKNEDGDVTVTSEIVSWDSTKDFQNQSGEVKEFIGSLLANPNRE